MKPQITVEAFAEFCERKPADEKYNYTYSENCAVAQFLQSAGVQNYSLHCWEIPKPFREPVVREPWNFGALARRLRASL